MTRNKAYPENLLMDIFGYSDPADVIEYTKEDNLNGLNTALQMIDDRKRDILKLYYQDGLTYRQIAIQYSLTYERIRQICARGLSLLRSHARSKFIKFGVEGVKRLEEEEKARREAEWTTVLGNNYKKVPAHEALMDLISVRSYNCLHHHTKILTIEEVEAMTDEELLQIRNLGRKCVMEIRDAIKKTKETCFIDQKNLHERCNAANDMEDLVKLCIEELKKGSLEAMCFANVVQQRYEEMKKEESV